VSDSRSGFSYRDISHTALRGYVQLFLHIAQLAQTCKVTTQAVRFLVVDAFNAVRASEHQPS
jgi:hypothetical protein